MEAIAVINDLGVLLTGWVLGSQFWVLGSGFWVQSSRLENL